MFHGKLLFLTPSTRTDEDIGWDRWGFFANWAKEIYGIARVVEVTVHVEAL